MTTCYDTHLIDQMQANYEAAERAKDARDAEWGQARRDFLTLIKAGEFDTPNELLCNFTEADLGKLFTPVLNAIRAVLKGNSADPYINSLAQKLAEEWADEQVPE